MTLACGAWRRVGAYILGMGLMACGSGHAVEEAASERGERVAAAGAATEPDAGAHAEPAAGAGGAGASGTDAPPASEDADEDTTVRPSSDVPDDELDPSDPLVRYGVDTDPPHPIFDQTQLRHYDVEVDPDEWAYINETAYLEEYIEGTVSVDGATYNQVGVRFKGFRGSLYNCFIFDDTGQAVGRICDKLSIKLSFNHYDPEGRFLGLKKLNFHSMNNDGTKLRERLAYFLFRRFGVPAPRAVHATLSINGESLGLYALVEQVDGRFTRARFDDGGEGNLYKERWPASSADAEYFLSGLKTNEDDPDVDVSAMQRFAEAVRGADAETIEAVLREHTDFDAFMRYMAVDRAIENWDGVTAFRCQPEEEVPALPPEVYAAQTPPLGWEVCQNKNFYWYEEEQSARHWLIAWDTDISLGSIPNLFPQWDVAPESCPIRQSGRPPMCDRLIAAVATVLRPYYVSAGRAFLEDVFRPDVVEPAVRAWAEQIRPYLDGSGGFFDNDPLDVLDRAAQYHSAFSQLMQSEP